MFGDNKSITSFLDHNNVVIDIQSNNDSPMAMLT